MEMILTGRPVGAEEALRIGLANEVVPEEKTLDRALELAHVIGASAFKEGRTPEWPHHGL